MKLEVLYPELCNIHGDSGNVRYLRSCMPELEVVETWNGDTPRFVTERVDMLYLGAMTERRQRLALRRLLPYRDELWARIEDGVVVLATGNAQELFGERLVQDGQQTEALGYFPFEARIDTAHRHNSMFLGQFEGMDVVGNKSQFSFCYGRFDHPFLKILGGYGNNGASDTEGIHYRNLFGTQLLGPLLPLNPPFTKYLLRLLGHDGALAFEAQAMDAYEYRRALLRTPGVNFRMGEHG